MRNTPEYKAQETITKEFLYDGLENYIKYLKLKGINLKGNSRVATGCKYYDIVRAISYDLLRYATFHHIKKEGDAYLISEAVRAAYMVKWILMLRPLDIDNLAENTAPAVFLEKKITTEEQKNRFLRNKILHFCNEYLAIYVADQVISPEIDGTRVFMLDILSEQEANTFIYSLRYRLRHQDVFQPLFNRMLHTYK